MFRHKRAAFVWALLLFIIVMMRSLIIICIFSLSGSIVHGVNDEEYRILSRILGPAEKFFQSLKNSEYDTAWDLLSGHSQKIIVNDVYEASRKFKGNIQKEDIVEDFNRRGMMFTQYWNSFLRTFDADMILEQSQWDMGPITGSEADIIIQHGHSYKPTILKMRKEKEGWRVGLVETFWQSRRVNFLRFLFR